MTDVESHKRVHDMLLGPLERPTLRWLSAHMPVWMNPDILTGIGILGSFIIAFGYVLTNIDRGFLWLASLGFFVNWFGDSLDGTLARYREIERPRYGYFIDHTVDAFSQAVIFVGLGLSAYVRLDLAGLACIGYLLVSVHSYVNAFVSGEFRISYAKIGPTEMRLIAVLVNTLVYTFGNPRIGLGPAALRVFDWIIAVIAAAEVVIFLTSTLREAARWRRLDPGSRR